MPENSLRSVLSESLSVLSIEKQDEAAKELALILAEQIDMARKANNSRAVAELGSKLTTLLVELMMTPKSRQAIKELKEVDSDDTERLLFDLQHA